VKVNKLKGKIVERGMNIESLAKLIGVDRATLYRKLNDAEKITIGEAAKIKDVLEISESDAYDIFLA
jgi:plasmid maintenance system antidote protein VapI